MICNNLNKIRYRDVAVVLIFTVIITTTCLMLTMDRGYEDEDVHVLLEEQTWIHGAENCTTQSDPLIQIVRYNENTWILRQNKCLHYESPFMFLLKGKNKTLLVDTGAIDSETFPLYDTVINLLEANELPLIVAHTHSHSDHFAGDGQFKGKNNISVVGLQVEDVKTFFNFNQWPDGIIDLDLGERMVQIFPIPGHQIASIAFYDNSSKLFLTGDTFYPGRLYVEDWNMFKQSIAKLFDFAMHNEISYIVGNHIEMSSKSGIDYPTGSTYQPEEQKLPLTVEDLGILHGTLQKTSDIPERIVFDKFIVSPK